MDAELRDHWLAHTRELLAEAGRRTGAARTAVIDLLAREGQCLLSAQDIVERLRKRRRVSAASVYRALEELHELGLLERVDGRDGTARYEIAAPQRARHHHFFDEDSGAIIPFTDDALERAIAEVASRLGVRLTSHEVTLRGMRDRSGGVGDRQPAGGAAERE